MKRFRPQLESLDARIVPAASASLAPTNLGLTLTITGDNGANSANVINFGAGVGNIAGAVDGQNLRFLTGIDLTTVHVDAVVFKGGKGNDAMNYVAPGLNDVLPSVDTVNFSGGKGNDYFRAVVGGIEVGNRLNINAGGGAGRDRLITQFEGALNGVLNTGLSGDGGNDYVNTFYSINALSGGLVNTFVASSGGKDNVDLNLFNSSPGTAPVNYLVSNTGGSTTFYSAVLGDFGLGGGIVNRFSMPGTTIGTSGDVNQIVVA